MITQTRLKELLHFDKESGNFRWISKTSKSRVRVGDVAGYKAKLSGYLRIRIDRKQYAAHRLAFLFIEGVFPVDQVDHINGVRDDNRWNNLRHATRTMNMQNQRQANRDNKTGFLGVSPNGNGFAARIGYQGKKINLGLFDTPEQAHSVYLVAKRKLHEGCTL